MMAVDAMEEAQMGYTSRQADTERIPLDDEWWVDVKKCLSVAESEAAERALMTMTVEQPDPQLPGSAVTAGGVATVAMRANPDIFTNLQEMVVASVVAWNLTDDDDQVLPLEPDAVKRQSISRLHQADYDKIAARVRVLNGGMSAAERRQFPDGGGGGVTVGSNAASDPGGILD